MTRYARTIVVLALLGTAWTGAGSPISAGVGPIANPGLDAFPPMPADDPPGASHAARAGAAGLGRGVNFGNMLDAPTEGAWRLVVRDEFIDVTAEAGFASVRLPVRWSNHAAATPPFIIDPPFLARVESVVDKLLAKNLYVVLNMHHYHQLDGDGLNPGEFAVDGTLVEVRFLMLWRQIAERFRGKNGRLVFELYNEPHGRVTAQTWNDLAARALNVVRQSNPDRIVIIGPASWNAARALPALRLPNDANLVVTIHNYEPFNFTHQGATWVRTALPTGVRCCDAAQQAAAAAPLASAKAWSDAARYPIFLGEFGAYSKADMESRVAFTRLMRDQSEARGMSWSYWELAAGFGVYDRLEHTWRAPLKEALLGR